MAEMDTCTLACGSHCSCQLLPSCPYWQWIKISSVHLDLIKADQSAAVKAFRSIPSIAPLAYSYVWIAFINWNSSVLHVSVLVTGFIRLGHSNQLYWPLPELYAHFYYFFAFRYDSSRHQFEAFARLAWCSYYDSLTMISWIRLHFFSINWHMGILKHQTTSELLL